MVSLRPEDIDTAVKHANWETKPLRTNDLAEEYPIEFLTPIIRGAVLEIVEYVQAPSALVAGCALAAVSAAVQTHTGVQRDSALHGPAGLFVLTVAESGERKSTVDKLLLEPIRKWEAGQNKLAAEAEARFKVEHDNWVKAGQALQGAEGSDCDDDALVQHLCSEPSLPRTPRLLRMDDTPEALAVALSKYPVAAVMSAEGGVIFGSPGMNTDTVVRNLALANHMWDGGPIDQDRITRDRIRIEDVRVTMGIQVQPAVLDHFLNRTGGLARGIGYFSRFLMARPETTQGLRFYKEPPAAMPRLQAFHTQITNLLSRPAEIDEFDRLQQHYVSLSDGAYDHWIGMHNAVEEQIGSEDDYSGIRDVASKAAENAARIACCLHTFEATGESSISIDTMMRAWRLMDWYLQEAVRFSKETSVSPEVRNAELLEEWIVRQHRSRNAVELTVNMVRQKGPNSLRSRVKLDAAIELLVDHGRIRVFNPSGTKKHQIIVSPLVFEDWR